MKNRISRTAIAATVGAIVAAALPTAGVAAGTWDEIAERGIVRVGVVPNRACYYWQEIGKDEWLGFPVQMSRDLVEAFGKELGKDLTIEWVPTSYNTVVLDLQSSKIDFFMGMAETPERKAATHMFGPLWAVPDVLVARPGVELGTTWDEFNKPEFTVAVAMGTTTEQSARSFLPQSQIKSLKTTNDAILDVQSGKSDFFLNTLILGLMAMKENSNLANLVVPEPVVALPTGAATRKDGDGRFGDFAQGWATAYYDSGRVSEVILGALAECGLDTSKLPENITF